MFGIRSLTLEWERDYGINRKTGWSVALNGSYLVALEPWLIVALWKAFKEWWIYYR